MTVREELEQWLVNNRLAYKFVSDVLFTIEGAGSFYIIQEKDGVIVNEKFELQVNDDEWKASANADYYAYKFGHNWYYTGDPSLTLQELRYLGKEADSSVDMPILGVHGRFDLCNGSRLYKDWAKKAKFCDVTCLGIAEENTLAGVLEFQNDCEKAGIKSIIGETITVEGKGDKYSLKLYVESAEGWKNLLLINSCINVHNETQHISEDQLLTEIKSRAGLVCVITPDVRTQANRQKIAKHFDRVYYQIDPTQWDAPQRDDEWLASMQDYISKDLDNIPPVLITDAFYLEKDQAYIRKDLHAIGKVSFKNQSSDQYFKTPTEICLQFEKLLDNTKGASEILSKAIDNTNEFESISFKISTGNLYLPEYIMTKQENLTYESKDDLLWQLIEQGIEEKVINRTVKKSLREYKDRVKVEMGVICEAKLQDYFLITWDILNWARTQGIMTGFGRGSAAGCLVAYLLGIVQTDPLEYDLLFERFLNEGRLYKYKKVDGWYIAANDEFDEYHGTEYPNEADAMGALVVPKEIEIRVTGSMPDIDNDIAGERREEVKRYIESRYGVHRVASIGTYGELKIKSALQDLGKIHGIPTGTMLYIGAAISDDKLDYAGLFKYALKGNNTIKRFIEDNPELVEKLPLVLGQLKTASMHAAGVIIVPESENGIFDQLPVKKVDGVLISEWEMEYIEQAGFLKMDLLGLKQLDKFTEIIQLIKEQTDNEIKLEDIPLDDKMVYEYFSQGFNEDVFQFGGGGLKGYTKTMEPETIDHLIATVALYRPGPIEMKSHEEYVERKKKPSRVKYPFGTETILNETYGLMCYQEQIMKIVQHVAGFTLNEADDIRKAIGKKLPELMKKYKERYVEGAVANGCPRGDAMHMWDEIEGFGGYSFNKSHATCYAVTGYYCQWFKVNYPLQFWLVALKHAGKDQVTARLSEMSQTGQKQCGGPNINYSTDGFTTDGSKIFWSLLSIKQVGEGALQDILKERETNGHFFSITEFATRMKGTAVRKNVIVNLILAGAFDDIHGIKDANAIKSRFSILEQFFNFSGSKIDESTLEMKNWQSYQWTIKQRELCGLGLFDVERLYGDFSRKRVKEGRPLKSKKVISLVNAIGNSSIEADTKGKHPAIAGLISKVTHRSGTKGGYAFVDITDGTNIFSGAVWSETYAKFKAQLIPNSLIVLDDVWLKYDAKFKQCNVFNTTNSTEIVSIY